MKKQKLTRKQEKFVKEFIDTGNGTQSALKAYDTTDEVTAGSIAWENLRKPQIQQAIQDSAKIAQSVILELAKKAKNEQVRLGASKDILDRAGFKPVEKQEVKQEIIDNSLTEEEKQKLKNLIK